MTDHAAGALRRVARPPAPSPLTPARALRLAVTRAARTSVGLPLAVLGVAQDEGPLDDLLDRLEDGLTLVVLDGPGGALGLIGLDLEARAVVVEAQTLGRVAPHPPEDRPATRADLALAEPLLDALLAEVGAATEGTALAGWPGAARPGGRLASPRDAALAIPDGPCRAVRLTLDLGPGGRQGLLVILARLAPAAAPAADAGPGWDDRLAAQVLRAKAPVEAVLGRLRLPVDAVEGFAAGQVLPLPGLSVASVRLTGPGGRDLGPARLGQVAGLRAVRVEAPPGPVLGPPPELPGA